jgi:hypothetical protein
MASRFWGQGDEAIYTARRRRFLAIQFGLPAVSWIKGLIFSILLRGIAARRSFAYIPTPLAFAALHTLLREQPRIFAA